MTMIKDYELVDHEATQETQALFLYLNRVRKKHVLFGHQHTTTQGVTISKIDGSESDVLNAVGDYPAVYGWDTLSLHGVEEPYTPEATAEVMKRAYEREGIITLSGHFPNFVSGSSMYDLEGNVVKEILPGGQYNKTYTEFLDTIAFFANELLVTDEGIQIPVIFRPFHEQNGDWFWWGAPYCSNEEYIEIFRYTVAYLRDEKNVHQFLYAYSPNGPFDGQTEKYFSRYPGDDFVDVLGFDIYDEGIKAGWMKDLVKDLRMLVQTANRKNKIPALTEIGAKDDDTGVKTYGNRNADWWQDLLEIIKKDPVASRIAWILTWRNGSLSHMWVPYRNHPTEGDSEMLEGFKAFYEDEWTYFNKDLNEVYRFPKE